MMVFRTSRFGLRFVVKSLARMLAAKVMMLCVLLLASSYSSEAATYYYRAGSPNPNLPSSWNTLIGGGGANATNFTTNNDIFIIPNGRMATLTAPLVLGTGANGVDLIIQSGGTLNTATFYVELAGNTGNFDLQAGGTWRIGFTEGFNGWDNLTGSLRMTAAAPGTVTYSPTANYVLDDVSTAVGILNTAGGVKPAITQANNLTVLNVTNPAQWYLSGPLTLTGALTIQNGGEMTLFSTLTLNGAGSQVQTGGILNFNGAGVLANNGGLTMQSGSSLLVFGVTNSPFVTGMAVNYAAGSTLWYQSGTLTTTGLELPATMNGDLYFYQPPANALTLGGPTTVNGGITLLNTLNTSAANMLTIGNTGAAAISQSGAGQIQGPMRRVLPAGASAGTWLFPVSKAGNYMPFAIQNPNTTGGATIQVEGFNTATGGTGDGGSMAGALNNYYWLAQEVAGNFNSGLMQVGRAGLVATNGIGSSTVLAGTYSSNGSNTYNGVPTPPTLTRTVTDNLAAPTYFAVGTALMNVAGNAPPFTPRPATTPLLNAINIGLGTNVVIPFSQNLNAGTVNAANFRVHAMFTGLKTAGYAQAGATATVNPTVNFKRGEQVWVSVTNAQSTGGVNTRPFVMGFRTAAGAGPATFFPTFASATGTTPYTARAGDLDGDGDLDLAVPRFGGNNVGVLMNTGTGLFAPAVNYATGTQARDVEIGDFNGDGLLDLAVINYGANNVSVLLNTGGGVFAAAVNYGTATQPQSVAAADVDGDGDLDLVTGNSVANVSVLLNNGNGTFAAAVNYAAGGNVNSLTVGDFDGDGDIDLAAANFTTNFASVLLNTGGGVFGSPLSYAVGTNAIYITNGDIDGDGDLDLAVLNLGSANVSILRNNGNGTFAATVNYGVGTNPNSVMMGDFDGDGDLDLAVTNNGTNTISILQNTGGGVFATAVNYETGGVSLSYSTVGDFDGDGDLDIAAPHQTSNNVIILKNGYQPTITTFAPARNTNTAAVGAAIAPVFNQTMTTATASAPVMKVWGGFSGLKTAGTYSGGGGTTPSFQPSVATQFRPGEQVWVTVTNAQTSLAGSVGIAARPTVYGFRAAAGAGPGTFIAGSAPAVGASPFTTKAGDLDGDGDIDLAVSIFGGNNVGILMNTGTGTFAPVVNYATGTQARDVEIGDFNGDGRLDLAVINYGGNNVSVLLNTGGGVFAAAVNYGTGANPQGIAAADVDGDGDLDLLVGDGTGKVDVFLNNGNGTFAAMIAYPISTSINAVTVGDFDGDGDIDVATANYLTNFAGVILNRGDGTFGAAVNYAVGTTAYYIASGDIDGDGDIDLAVTNVGSANVSILRNNGNGTFAPAVNYGVGTNPYGVTMGDFDGDGDLDLAVMNGGSNNVSILLNSGAGVFALSGNFPTGTNPYGLTMGDFDGDGDLDLATANNASNNVSILFNAAPMNVTNNYLPFGIPPVTPTFNTMTAALGTNVVIPFNQALSAPTVNAANFKVFGGFTGLKAATYGAAGATATVTPTQPFKSGEQVFITVTNATSSGGTATRPFVMGFRTAAGAGPATFFPMERYATGTNSRGVATGDFDSDGDLDLAVVNTGSSDVSILLNTGTGSFAAAVNYGVGTSPNVPLAADLNGDGLLDIVTTNNSNSVSVLLNTGGGVFGAAATYTSSGNPHAVQAADLDGDGDLDLAVANPGTDNVSVLLNNGSGVFSAAVYYAAGTDPYGLTAGDFDGDGDIDVVSANNGNISVLLNTGLGTFLSAVNYPIGGGGYNIASGDIDGDGDLDVAIGYFGGSTIMSVVFNNGSGIFGAATDYSLGGPTNSLGIVLADFDGDGDLDVATGNQVGTSSLFLNNGVGIYGAAVITRRASSTWRIAAGDFDGDGDLDIAAPSSVVAGDVQILKNGYQPVLTTFAPARNINNAAMNVNIAPIFSQTMTTATASAPVMKVFGGFSGLKTAGTYSGGGGTTPSFQPSVATQFRPGEQVWVTVTNAQTSLAGSVGIAARPQVYGFRTAAGVGPGTFVAGSTPAVGTTPRPVALGDVDGDGDLDLAVANYGSNNVSILLNTGTGAYAAAVNYGVGTSPQSVALGDVDGDGDLDLAVANTLSNNVSILLNTGAGVYAAAANYNVGTTPHFVTMGDFDGDGDLDLAVANYGSNNVSILLNTGTGAYAAAVNYAVGTGPQSISVGDFDGDGDLDLVSANFTSNDVNILLNGGLGVYSTILNYSVGTNPESVTVGDLDGDGDLDLATANLSGNTSILLNTGSGTFAAAVNYTAGTGSIYVQAGDVDGDGDLDLAVANYISNNVSILFNNGIGIFATTVNYTVGVQPFSVSAGDVDNDGDLDLVVANANSNNVSILFNAAPMNVTNNAPPFGIPPTTPTFNTMTAALGTNVVIPFNQTLSAPTVNAANFRVHGGFTGLKTATYGAAGATATVTPTQPFKSGEQVFVTVTNATSAGGTATRPFVMGFRTAGGVGPATFYPSNTLPKIDNNGFAATDVGDLDGDGDLDIVSTNAAGLAVHLQTGVNSGVFSLSAPFGWGAGSGAAARSLKLADVNNDGILDALALNAFTPSALVVWFGNGVGGFGAAAVYTVVGSNVSSLSIGDIDADGDLDAVSGDFSAASVYIWRNNGTGVFTSSTIPGVTGVVSTALGDIDGDGDLDLVKTDVANLITLINNGLGTFSAPTSYAVGASLVQLTLADMNGDGSPDAVFGDGTTVQVRLNNGTGTVWTASAGSPYTTAAANARVTVADFNGDGRLDISSLTGTAGTPLANYILLNGGGLNPTFAPVAAGANYSRVAGFLAGAINSVTSGDMDGDGDIDVVYVTDTPNNVTILKNGVQPTITTLAPTRNTNTAALAASISPTFNQTMTTATASASVMKVWGGFTGLRTGTYSGGGTVTPSLAPTVPFRPGEQVWVTVTNAQTSLAGSVGIAARPQVYGFRTAAGVGPGTFVPLASYPTAGPGRRCTMADFDGDGNLDVVTPNIISNNSSVFFGAGGGTMGAQTPYGTGNSPQIINVADFNNDGKSDYVFANGGIASVTVCIKGAGLTFTPTNIAVGGTNSGLATGDFNGDGNMDIVVRLTTGMVQYLQGNGDGTFQAAVNTVLVGAAVDDIAAGDFNGDGAMDVIGIISATDQLQVLLGSGTGAFSALTAFSSGSTAPHSLAIADYDGDGNLDIAVTLSFTLASWFAGGISSYAKPKVVVQPDADNRCQRCISAALS